MQHEECDVARTSCLKQLSNVFSNTLFLDDEYHSEEYLHSSYDDRPGDSSWRLKEKMRTAGVALVVCLNIGIDPPDMVKPNPCARKQCWYDPLGQKQKGLEHIGNALQAQYEKWQSKAKFKQCLDPTSEELRKVCMNLRKSARSDRLMFHYNGHGVPKPTKNGELWVFGKHYTHYTPVAICELRQWLGDPAIYVLDCSAAGLLLPHLVDNMHVRENDALVGFEPSLGEAQPFNSNATLSFLSQSAADNSAIVFAACKGHEQLPFHPNYPADIFTACLTTPTTIAIRWFILQNQNSMHHVDPDIAETIPGKENDRKTPRGELNWILTAITDTIAWNTLPSKLFQKMFRKDLLVASLFRNFVLAKRIMKSFNCTPQSWPPIPDSTTHQLWQSWDMALESFLTQYAANQKGASMVDARNNMSFSMPGNLSFFNDQLSAFEMWLEYGTSVSPHPTQLPVVLQVLLSQAHRMRALQLLKRFLALGPEAIKLSLIIGIFPYILKLLQNPADDIKQTLISIWATVIGFDSSCRQELVREKSQVCFVQCLSSSSVSPEHRCLAAFVLAEVCNGYKEGQLSCLQLGLHRACTSILTEPDVQQCAALKLWTCLCLFKLCEDFLWAKYLCIAEASHARLYPLLIDADPTVRAAAVLALGELFGASSLSSSAASASSAVSSSGYSNTGGSFTPASSSASLRNTAQMRQSSFSSTCSSDDGSLSLAEEKDLREAELQLALQILECCTDGSVMVRVEAIYALSKFFVQPAHLDCIKVVAKALYARNVEKRQLKAERRSASPMIASAADAQGNHGPLYAWHLTAQEAKDIAAQVEAHMRQRMEESGELSYSSSVSSSQMHGSSLLGGESASRSHNNINSNKGGVSSNSPSPNVLTLMASAYLRLWLALTEVQGKDSHAVVAHAAATIRFRVHCLAAIDDRRAALGETKPRSASNLSQQTGGSYSSFSPFQSFPGPSSDPKLRRQFSAGSEQTEGVPAPPALVPMSPMGLLASPGNTRSSKSVKFGSRVPRASPFLMPPEGQYALSLENHSQSSSSGGASSHPALASSLQSQSKTSSASPVGPAASAASAALTSALCEAFKDFSQLPEEDLLVSFSSNHYDMAKRQFMEPCLGYDPADDPLSAEAKMSAYRVNRLRDIITSDKALQETFRDVEERPADLLASLTMGGPAKSGLSKAALDDSKAPSVTASTVPNNICKFEQKNSLYMDSPMASSLVMFHAMQDVLVVGSESTASVWSLSTNSKIMEVKNKHVLKPGFVTDGVTPLSHTHSAANTPGRNNKGPTVVTNTDSSLFSAQSSARITAMNWLNESYDSLLLLGSDDGVVKVWRDVSCSDSPSFSGDVLASGPTGGPSTTSSPAISSYSSNVELATAFAALPDIAETTRGSGLVLSWQQATGTLVAGGNSNTIRVWDLGREQNVRVFQTGMETCLSAIASTSVSNTNPFNSHNHYSVGDVGSPSQSNPVSWIFAGFADGSTGVYDERVHSNGGRVHQSHTHGHWVNHAHLRVDVPEVLVSSVRGTVKFWDLRMMRTYKALEVQKSPLTSLAVHNCAPIMASGSQAQFIKILTLGGEQLGNIIKYYDGFLGQRIGPVSCLSFHPHKLLLASSSTDGIVSLYGAASEK